MGGKPPDLGYRLAWIVGGAAWAVLFVEAVIGHFITARPKAWLGVTAGFDLLLLFLILQALAKIVSSHSLAPPSGRVGSGRFYLMFIGIAVAPCLLLAAPPAIWDLSIGWAIIWAVGGVGLAAMAYYAGRPLNVRGSH